jgi:1-acyl-sn-glycerol-3-phosphate acyltransferase
VIEESEIAAWIVAQLARELDLDPDSIDAHKPIAVLGLDSLAAATLTADLEDHFGRSLPETLFDHRLTIAALSRIVAAVPPDAAPPASAQAPPPRSDERRDHAAADYDTWTLAQRILRSLARALARALTRQDVEGAGRLPPRGPVIIAVNHLHILDALWVFAVIPRRTVFMVAREFRHRLLVGQLLRLGQSIFVERGTGDSDAIRSAVDALRAGAAIGIAPEGRLSTTGGLLRGQPGLARIAADAGAPVVPLAVSGQEQLWRWWRRGRRVPVRVRFGEVIPPPSARATARALERYSDAVMRALAAELPPAYRGIYRAPP